MLVHHMVSLMQSCCTGWETGPQTSSMQIAMHDPQRTHMHLRLKGSDSQASWLTTHQVLKWQH